MKKHTIRDITDVMEQAAPLAIALEYDNVGLIVGDWDREVSAALLCVDVTQEVMDEALKLGADLIISHHPIIFHPLKRLNGSNYVERIVEQAIKNDIAIYASHTNLDAVEGGLSHKLASIVGLRGVTTLSPHSQSDPQTGFGVIGELEREMDSVDFLQHLRKKFNLNVIRHSDICKKSVRKVAICSGSGASLIEIAAHRGADIYIAADFKYNDFMTADGRLIVADIGHFESEYCAIEVIYGIITKKISTFVVHKSAKSRNPINYLV